LQNTRSAELLGLIDAFEYNQSQGNGPLNAFEIGRVFWQEEEGLAEADAIVGILGGDPTQGKWTRRRPTLTWFEAKGVLESVFQRFGLMTSINLTVRIRACIQDVRLFMVAG